MSQEGPCSAFRGCLESVSLWPGPRFLSGRVRPFYLHLQWTLAPVACDPSTWTVRTQQGHSLAPARKSSYKDILNRSSSRVRLPPLQITGTWAGKAESAGSVRGRPEILRGGILGGACQGPSHICSLRPRGAAVLGPDHTCGAFSGRTDKADDSATWWQQSVRPSLSRRFADAREWTGVGANGGPHGLQDVSSQAHTYLLG